MAGVEDETWFWATELAFSASSSRSVRRRFFGQYYSDEGGSNARRTVFENNAVSRILDTGYSYWGGGVVQFVEDAALELYLYYRHSTAEMTLVGHSWGWGPCVRSTLRSRRGDRRRLIRF